MRAAAYLCGGNIVNGLLWLASYALILGAFYVLYLLVRNK